MSCSPILNQLSALCNFLLKYTERVYSCLNSWQFHQGPKIFSTSVASDARDKFHVCKARQGNDRTWVKRWKGEILTSQRILGLFCKRTYQFMKLCRLKCKLWAFIELFKWRVGLNNCRLIQILSRKSVNYVTLTQHGAIVSSIYIEMKSGTRPCPQRKQFSLFISRLIQRPLVVKSVWNTNW